MKIEKKIADPKQTVVAPLNRKRGVGSQLQIPWQIPTYQDLMYSIEDCGHMTLRWVLVEPASLPEVEERPRHCFRPQRGQGNSALPKDQMHRESPNNKELVGKSLFHREGFEHGELPRSTDILPLGQATWWDQSIKMMNFRGRICKKGDNLLLS